MGLARSADGGVWNVNADLESVLRAMQRTGDRQKTLRAHGAVLSDERLAMDVFDFRQKPVVEGRVVVHGEDEQTGRRYLMLEGVDARVHYIEYTPEMEASRACGELRTNAFVRLRRVINDEEETVEVEDFGNAESLLKDRKHVRTKAQEALNQGALLVEQGWGGWLGRYQRALTQAAMDIEYPTPPQQKARERFFGR
jgi:hypothetical protein